MCDVSLWLLGRFQDFNISETLDRANCTAALSQTLVTFSRVTFKQTKRDLKSRLAKHKLAIKNQEPEKSGLCVHSIQFDHLID